MSAPVKMYPLRQIVQHDTCMKLPACMYKLKSIHGQSTCKNGTSSDHSAARNHHEAHDVSSKQASSDMHEINDLARRQKAMLSQLDQLKGQMASIRKSLQLGPNTTNTAQSVPKQRKLNVKKLFDVSLNVNPKNPPYSLVLLKKILKEQVNLHVQMHQHSNLPELPECVQSFTQELDNCIEKKENLPTWNVRIIWKDIGINEFEWLCNGQTILGEVNFLRFLARSIGGLNYEEQNVEVDPLLDTAAILASCRTKTNRMNLLRTVSKQLGKSNFVFQEFSIVDLALYSAVRQSVSDGELTVSLNKWLKNCESI